MDRDIERLTELRDKMQEAYNTVIELRYDKVCDVDTDWSQIHKNIQNTIMDLDNSISQCQDDYQNIAEGFY